MQTELIEKEEHNGKSFKTLTLRNLDSEHRFCRQLSEYMEKKEIATASKAIIPIVNEYFEALVLIKSLQSDLKELDMEYYKVRQMISDWKNSARMYFDSKERMEKYSKEIEELIYKAA